MSIKSGLIQKTDQVSDVANIINTVQDMTDSKERLSILYNRGGNFHATKRQSIKGKTTYSAEILTKKDFTYGLAVYDAQTKTLIDPELLNFEIVYSNKSSNYSTNKDNQYFYVTFHNVAKEQLTLTIRISGTNYLQTYAQITSEKTTNTHIQNIEMVHINNVPEGVSVVSTMLVQNQDGTVQEYTLDFPQTTTHAETASIVIPQGMKFYDKNNNQLTGTLSVKAGHFSGSSMNATSLFSSGWNVPNVLVNNQSVGENGTYSFISCGFYSMEVVDSSGSVATSVS